MANPLVGVDELAAALASDRPPLLLDVRWRLGGPPGVEAYRAGHLPGAVYADLDRDLAGPAGAGGRHPLPSPADAQAALRRLGVSGHRPVVAYDDVAGTVAARVWWLLRYLGHDDVRLLDGGYAAWTAARRPVEQGDGVAPMPGDFVVRPGGMPVLDAAAAAALAGSGVLLDVRTAERYRGEVEPIDPVAGHVPGAVSAPAAGVTGDGDRFRPPAVLRERFGALGVVDGTEVGVYCGSGVTAAQTVLALELAGVPAALYVGSWSEWVSDPSRPVATGDG